MSKESNHMMRNELPGQVPSSTDNISFINNLYYILNNYLDIDDIIIYKSSNTGIQFATKNVENSMLLSSLHELIKERGTYSQYRPEAPCMYIKRIFMEEIDRDDLEKLKDSFDKFCQGLQIKPKATPNKNNKYSPEKEINFTDRLSSIAPDRGFMNKVESSQQTRCICM